MTLNLNALLVKWSEERASHKAFIYLGHGDKTEAEVTFSELYRQSSKIAHYLFEKHTSASTILLLFNSPFEFIKAFFGCLLAGKIAIPMFPPRNRKKIDRLVRILQNANSSLILTSNKVKTKLFERNDLGIELDFQVEEIEQALDTEFSGVFDPLGVPQNEVAMLQYTSGSAGVPKGVIVTHQNILANQSVIKESFGHSDQTVFGTWLPFFHDMGLVGNILQPFYLGITCVLFTPEGFVQKPIRWIKAISDFGVTTSGAPNFAYDLCTARIDDAQLSDIDLSSWSVAYNGAEPISPNTLDRFTKKFEKCGFKRSSFFPCYGMAETTLIATGGDYRKDPVVVTIDGSKLAVGEAVTFGVPTDGNSKQIVGCGKAWQDNHLKIVDPKNCTSLPDGHIGEIWMNGSSVTQGYWGKEKENHEVFQASLSNGANTSPIYYLRTGDLGFFKNDELYILGRLKDLIIIRGRNYYPQDIEWEAEKAHPSLKMHSNAAFSIEIDDREELILVQEIRRSWIPKIDQGEVKKAIKAAITNEFEVNAYEIVLVTTFSIPKTSSNKIMRKKTRELYLNQQLVQL